MATLEDPPATAAAHTVGDVLRDHRAAWAREVLGDGAVDLADAPDPAAALASAEAALWVDGYESSAVQAVAEAAERGARLIVAVPPAEAEALADRIGGGWLPQSVVAGSLIGTGEAAAAVEPAGPGRPGDLALVHANVDSERIERASARLSAEAGEVLLGHVTRLEQALASLQAANVRLARERLGRHDAAAGTVVGRIEQRALAAEEQARHWEERFKYEQGLAITHHQWFESAQAKLNAPHHRAVERLYQGLLRYSGMRRLIRLLKR